jgi:radical SAM protein with 4Fe4S-binding SPASM domain
MSTGAYSPSKASAWPDRIQDLREGRQPYPVHLHLCISDLCDLDCPTCSYRWSGYTSNEMFGEKDSKGGYSHNPNRMLEVDLAKRILDDCKAMGTQAVEITGSGEPTIHPHAPEILGYAQSLGLDTALITNGLHLDRMADAAVKTHWLRVSVDAATADTYAKVRPSYAGPDRQKALANTSRSRTNFRKVCEAIRAAAIRRTELGSNCLIGVGFVVQKDNWREIYDAAELYRHLGADNIRISGVFSPEGADYHAGYRADAEALERKAVAELSQPPGWQNRQHGFTVYGRFHEKMEDLSARPDFSTCWYQELTTFIGGDANLYRCCVTSFSRQGLIGNVRDSGGFRKLWESSLKQFKFKKFDARTCARCQFLDKIRAIDHAVKAETAPEAPPDLVHKSFV